MKKLLFCCALLLILACQNTQKEQNHVSSDNPKEISFYTTDSLQIFGDLYVVDKVASTILLFHQGGGSAKGEYEAIIPTLMEEGFNILAIDQRRGGQRFGKYNRTVAEISKNEFGYCDAYLDLEGALNYIIGAGFSGKKLLWGSSYSASLAIQLASRRSNEVSAVLSFSPSSGGPMQACRPDELFESLKLPLLVVRPKREMEIESVQQQFALAEQYNHQTYIAENGVHGSSTLVEERVEGDVSAHWRIVKAFIGKFK